MVREAEGAYAGLDFSFQLPLLEVASGPEDRREALPRNARLQILTRSGRSSTRPFPSKGILSLRDPWIRDLVPFSIFKQ